MILLSVPEKILLFISGFGVLQAILLAALLVFHPRSDKSVNIFLALHIAAISLPVLMPVVQHVFSWQVLIFIEPLLTIIAPLLYFYVRSFKETITWKKAWPHFIFFVASIFMAFWNYAAVGSKFPPTAMVPKEASGNFILVLPLTLRLAQRIIYYLLSRRELNHYQRSIVHLFSDTSKINLNWVRWLVNGYLGVIVMTFVIYPLMLRYPEYFNLWVLISAALVSVYIYAATFKGITQLTLWQVLPEINKEKLEEQMQNAVETTSVNEIKEEKNVGGQETISVKTRPRKAGLSKSRIDEIVQKIIFTMESEKLYQEPELTSQQLAAKLNLPVHHLSQAINDGLHKNFYDLVNDYRVEEAKRLLLDPKNDSFTILSTGFEAGFNSKTTFNTVFKKFTGLTPTDFREKHKMQLASA